MGPERVSRVKQPGAERFKQLYEIHDYDPDREWPPEKWLVEDMFSGPQRLHIVSGMEKTGKSRFCMWMICCLLAGKNPWGLKTELPPPKVLWLLGEENVSTAEPRLTRYAEIMDVDPHLLKDRITFASMGGARLDHSTRRAELEDYALELGIDLLMLDPISRLHGAEENGSPELIQMLNEIRGWTQRHKWNVFLQHHVGKIAPDADLGRPATWLRGSTQMAGIFDSLVGLQRAGQIDKNAGQGVNAYRFGRHAPDGKVWKFKDHGREDKDRMVTTDLGWSLYNK
jgi:hypothetical protein